MPAQPQTLSVAETIALVNRYLRESSVNSDGQQNLTEVAEKLGWTVQQLSIFRRDYAALLNYEDECAQQGSNFVQMPAAVLPPSTSDILIPSSELDIEASAPSENEIASAVAAADASLLKNGLRGMGFSEEEAIEAHALQVFNQNHFRESMEIVASNGMRTSMKLAIQQRHVESRISQVRAKLAEYGDFQSDERDYWVREERLLMRQFTELAELINHIQHTWFQGTAVLAMAKMKMRGQGQGDFTKTQRSNKPGFRPPANTTQ